AAIDAHRKAVATAERLNRQSTQASGNEDLLVQVYARLAGALTAAGQYDQALESLHRADEYLAGAERQNPGLGRTIARRGEIIHGEADVYVARKDWEKAIPAFARLISIFESQNKRDPKNEFFLNMQPDLYASLAECYQGARRRDAAVQALRTALDRLGEIESRRPLTRDEAEQRKSHIARLAEWEP